MRSKASVKIETIVNYVDDCLHQSIHDGGAFLKVTADSCSFNHSSLKVTKFIINFL